MANGSCKILLTFDVELFFGKKSGSIENCIIKPTELILRQLEKKSVNGTFFIDASFLLFLKNNSLNADLKKMSRLISKIESENNEVALHIHPHWVDAIISAKSEFEFLSYDNYSILSFSDSYYEHCMKAHDILSGFLSSSITSFRAGGYCSQPFSDLENVFKNTDIYIDSSVVPNFKSSAKPFNFDYKNITNDAPYKFLDDNTKPDDSGSNIELPVTSFELSGINRVYEKLKRLSRKEQRFGDGFGLRFDNNVSNRFRSVRKVLTLDDSSYQEINTVLKKLDYANVVSHPKNFTPTSLKILDKILDNTKYKFYRCNDDF